eukprot:9475884-Pyramimonas_sp.AAC.1
MSTSCLDMSAEPLNSCTPQRCNAAAMPTRLQQECLAPAGRRGRRAWKASSWLHSALCSQSV